LSRTGEAKEGAEFVEGDLIFLRNHRTLVHHIPELLTIWGANLQGRPVKSYEQVLRYLLKYMMKDKPNSTAFKSILSDVVQQTEDEDPLRKAFQRVLMKTVGEHDLSKQECHHILNGLDFVEFSRKMVSVNVMGTRRVEPLHTSGNGEEMLTVTTNFVSTYWERDSDAHYKAAVEKFAINGLGKDPAKVSLNEFVSKYQKKWQLSGEVKVPRVTPNFNRIPNKNMDNSIKRYELFLKSILLVHQPGSRLAYVEDMSKEQLEEAIQSFCLSPGLLVQEEFEESQKDLDPEMDDGNAVDANAVDNLPGEGDKELLEHWKR
jgi:hypothetical protein